ncbi:MAG: HpcH/HpaI aldolase family protein [Pseudoclavibacter sp.]
MASRRSLRSRIRRGENVLGTFLLAFPQVATARAAAQAGADFVLIDGEHTGFGWETMTPVLAAARAEGSVPFVRIPSATRENIGLALDIGATGLMIPMVNSVAEAERVASWCRYPPMGVRGAMFGLAAHDFGATDPVAAMKRSNAETIVMAQVETAEALDCVEGIAAVDGIDIIWIGHFDLTISMGIPAQFDHPRYLEAVERIVAAAKTHGKAVGFLASGPDEAKALTEKGFTLLAYGSDLNVYRNALRDGFAAIRTSLDG